MIINNREITEKEFFEAYEDSIKRQDDWFNQHFDASDDVTFEMATFDYSEHIDSVMSLVLDETAKELISSGVEQYAGLDLAVKLARIRSALDRWKQQREDLAKAKNAYEKQEREKRVLLEKDYKALKEVVRRLTGG